MERVSFVVAFNLAPQDGFAERGGYGNGRSRPPRVTKSLFNPSIICQNISSYTMVDSAAN
ncbi:MAG: hypothetical protein GY943_01475 [Chloroflexi bacterium]|nr:hypothetical protein [Chloroflexota bacterium]